MDSTESRFGTIGLSDILFAGVYMGTFSPEILLAGAVKELTS